MRKTYIFGNGLGMAIAPDAYNLTAAMSNVWAEDMLSVEQKHLISSCLPVGRDQPTSEEELATLQDTVSACEMLLSVRDTGAGHWLSEQGRQFPEAVRKFAFLVARRMYLSKYSFGDQMGQRCCLPDYFVNPLIAQIRDTQSHVATLNYDGLLSSALKACGVLGGDQAILFDGFVKTKFDRRNMFRQKDFGGWYLHLHGGPLFADRGASSPYKLSDAAFNKSPLERTNAGRHIVLTHFTHKPKIIEASEILSIYWEFLERSFEESSEIVIFGYSGNDLHLNRLISQMRGDKVVKVIDWLGSGSNKNRTKFWNEQFGDNVDLYLLEDVLTFSDW
jgi:hypothetical protein